MDKTCTTCKVTKPYSEFYPSKYTDGFTAECKACKLEYAKRNQTRNNKVQRELRKRTGNAHLKTPYAVELRKKRQDAIREVKEQTKLHYGCMNPDCCWEGPFESFMLDFHHVDRSEKQFNLGTAHSKSVSKLSAEINKCVVLCAICHRMETWGELDCTSFPKCNLTSDGEITQP